MASARVPQKTMASNPPAHHLTAAQFRELTRYRYGLRKTRPAGVPKLGPRNGPYKYVYDRWANFDKWFLWRYKGDRRLRPGDVWKRVPAWEVGYSPWNLAGELLKTFHDSPPQPPPGSTTPDPHAYNGLKCVAVMAQETDGPILKAPRGTVAAFTADPAYAGWASSDRVQAHVNAGHPIAAWCNPSQISVGHLREFGKQIGAQHLIGQCETAGEFDDSVANGLTTMVGNLSSLRDDQFAQIESGAVHVVDEDYWNVQPWRVPNLHNLPCTTCPAVYGPPYSSAENPAHHYRPMREYEAAGRLAPGMWVYQPGMFDEDVTVWARNAFK